MELLNHGHIFSVVFLHYSPPPPTLLPSLQSLPSLPYARIQRFLFLFPSLHLRLKAAAMHSPFHIYSILLLFAIIFLYIFTTFANKICTVFKVRPPCSLLIWSLKSLEGGGGGKGKGGKGRQFKIPSEPRHCPRDHIVLLYMYFHCYRTLCLHILSFFLPSSFIFLFLSFFIFFFLSSSPSSSYCFLLFSFSPFSVLSHDPPSLSPSPCCCSFFSPLSVLQLSICFPFHDEEVDLNPVLLPMREYALLE